MIDRYTKIVLTVIAVSLAALALQGFTPQAVAAGLEGCGQSSSRPCHVSVANKVIVDSIANAVTIDPGWRTLKVQVDNEPVEVRIVGGK